MEREEEVPAKGHRSRHVNHSVIIELSLMRIGFVPSLLFGAYYRDSLLLEGCAGDICCQGTYSCQLRPSVSQPLVWLSHWDLMHV